MLSSPDDGSMKETNPVSRKSRNVNETSLSVSVTENDDIVNNAIVTETGDVNASTTVMENDADVNNAPLIGIETRNVNDRAVVTPERDGVILFDFDDDSMTGTCLCI